jgi:predicted enzyme involved in methoxymalonyl-ACP biosynthesis
MRVVFLEQSQYKTYQRKVVKLKQRGINLDITVANPNKRMVKLTVNTEHDWEELDRLC